MKRKNQDRVSGLTIDTLQPFHEAVRVLGLDDALNGFLNNEFSDQKCWKKWWHGMGGGDKERFDPTRKPPGFNRVMTNISKHDLYCRIILDPCEFCRKLYFFLFGCLPPSQTISASKKRKA